MRRASLLSLLLTLAAAAPSLPQAAGCRPPSALAQRLLGGASDWGELAPEATYHLDEAVLEEEGRLVARVTAHLSAGVLGKLRDAGAASLCLALVLDAEGELPVAHQRRVELGQLGDAESWTYGFTAELSEATSQLLLIVEQPEAWLFGAAIADAAGEPLAPGPTAVRLGGDGEPWVEVRRRPSSSATAATAAGATVLRLVPPRQQPASGPTRFTTLISTPSVDRVVFYLDGRQVAERHRKPFSARLELAEPPRVQTVRVVAFDSNDVEMGEDSLEVNRLDAPFRVRITGLTGDVASGSVEVAGRVSVPQGAALDRVELYYNDRLVASFAEPVVRHRVEIPLATPEDYLRLAAFLTDGSSIDDVVLLGAGAVEVVEVNLVELHVVASDAAGRAVEDLRQEDFSILFRGRRQPPQSFAHADDVSLLLGVVIDTSGSMQAAMADTQKAAAKFLGTTVLPQDRAFLADFARQPRLQHGVTGDVVELLPSLMRLQAEGTTAIYDAIVFAMLQFEGQPGRKALVMLTDGYDRDSRFSPRYCVETAQEAGVPIYFIGLAGAGHPLPPWNKKELRQVAEDTGGRLYLATADDPDFIAQLDAAYAQINAELRSQYSLTFYTDEDLAAEERRKVQVEVARPGHTARTVVGASRPSG